MKGKSRRPNKLQKSAHLRRKIVRFFMMTNSLNSPMKNLKNSDRSIRVARKRSLVKMTIVRKVINVNAPLTPEQKARLAVLKNMSDDDIVYDEDCPKLTDEQLKKFKRVNPHRKEKVAG